MQPDIPHNGLASNLRNPLKGFRREYRDRRQTARAARRLDPKGTQSAGGGGLNGLRRRGVGFRGLLCGVPVRSGDMVYRSPGTSFTLEDALDAHESEEAATSFLSRP